MESPVYIFSLCRGLSKWMPLSRFTQGVLSFDASTIFKSPSKMSVQYSGSPEARSWDIAYTVLVGVILLAVLPFAFLSLVKNSFGRDPARGFVPWLKASFCLFCLYVQGPGAESEMQRPLAQPTAHYSY